MSLFYVFSIINKQTYWWQSAGKAKKHKKILSTPKTIQFTDAYMFHLGPTRLRMARSLDEDTEEMKYSI